MKRLFPLGQIVITANALSVLRLDEVLVAMSRHVCGDWGIICSEDAASNNRALVENGRLLSAYSSNSGTRYWIITEWDRSSTTVLLPEEY